MVKGKVEINIIQGDNYQKNVLVEDVDLSYIEGVYFSCSRLNICKKLPYDSDIARYVFSLTADETKAFPPIISDYDITIKFTDEKVSTVSYRGRINVLPKINEVGCMSSE